MPKFEPGRSGNPAGRKRGTGHAEKLLRAIENDLPDIINAMVAAANNGDTSAAKILIDRIMPSLKPVGIAVDIGDLSGKSLSDQGAKIIKSMGAGKISPDQCQAMLAALSSLARIMEVDELEKRISALEAEHDDEENKNQST